MEEGTIFDQFSNKTKSSTYLPSPFRARPTGVCPVHARPRLSPPVHDTSAHPCHVDILVRHDDYLGLNGGGDGEGTAILALQFRL